MQRGLIIFVVVFQAVCTFFFVVNILASVMALPMAPMNWYMIEVIEIGAALGLLVGLVLGLRVLSRLMQRNARIESQLRAASGAFAELMEDHFEEWGLTAAERDVALFSLKGMSLQEIADIRGTSAGTVKAQTNAIYRKAGVNSRAQLLSLFIDDLMGEALPGVPEQPEPLDKAG